MSAQQGYLIDVTKQIVTAVTFDGYQGMQAHIGGFLEVAFAWDNGDVLYVDEEGLLKGPTFYFGIPTVRPDQPFGSNGLVVGREVEGDHYPAGYTTMPPTITLPALQAIVRWMVR